MRFICLIVVFSLVACKKQKKPEQQDCASNDFNISLDTATTPNWEYDFELGWNATHGVGNLDNMNPAAPEWRYAQMQTQDAGKTMEDPLNSGNQVMRFLWIEGEGTEYNSNTQKKAHLYGDFGTDNTQEEIWSFDIYFPSVGMESDSESEIVVQWHGHPDGCETSRNPPVAIDNKDDRLTLTWRFDDRDCTPAGFKKWYERTADLGETTKDQWINFVVYIKWDPFGCGAIHLWRDGNKLVEENGIHIGFNDEVGAYLGFGIYKYTKESDHQQRVVYFDNMKQWIL
ncbi:MAG: heparin lyase I family protein [Crocinitomicaceae bacterium]|nr:heparin lyase I family protein [Crocinitomicaceae bacterium]